MGIALGGGINELKHRLGELKDNLCEEFKLSTMSATKWERYRDGFLEKMQSDVSKESIQELQIPEDQLYLYDDESCPCGSGKTYKELASQEDFDRF